MTEIHLARKEERNARREENAGERERLIEISNLREEKRAKKREEEKARSTRGTRDNLGVDNVALKFPKNRADNGITRGRAHNRAHDNNNNR